MKEGLYNFRGFTVYHQHQPEAGENLISAAKNGYIKVDGKQLRCGFAVQMSIVRHPLTDQGGSTEPGDAINFLIDDVPNEGLPSLTFA